MNLLACKRYSYNIFLASCSVLIVSRFLYCSQRTLFSLIIHTQCAHEFYCGTAYMLHTDFLFLELTWQWCILQYFVAILYQYKIILLQPGIHFLQRIFLSPFLFIWMMFKGLCNYLKIQNTLEEKMKQEMTLPLTKGWLHFWEMGLGSKVP